MLVDDECGEIFLNYKFGVFLEMVDLEDVAVKLCLFAYNKSLG